MAKAVRLADIAKEVNVSIVTVSKALSGQKGVSEELRVKIKELADRMGYMPPSTERRNRDEKGYNIGVLIEESYLDRYASFYWQMYQQVTTRAMERQSFTMLEVITTGMENSMELPRLLVEQKVDGILVIGKLHEAYIEQLLEKNAQPIVFLDFAMVDKSADYVVSDNYYGAYYMTKYLLDMGHTEIAYVGTLLSTSSITDRYLGYVKALMEHGIPVKKEWQIDDRILGEGYIDEVNLIQLPENMPTAFFCNCDLTASKLINKLQKAGYRIPEDISVVGYDNYLYPGLCDVEITSYEVDTKEMARRAISTLIKKMNNESTTSGVHIVEGHIVIKNSVQRRDGKDRVVK